MGLLSGTEKHLEYVNVIHKIEPIKDRFIILNDDKNGWIIVCFCDLGREGLASILASFYIK